MLSVLPQIEQHLADAGVTLERPTFGGSAAVEHEDEGGAEEGEGEGEEEEEEEEEEPKPKPNSKRGRK